MNISVLNQPGQESKLTGKAAKLQMQFAHLTRESAGQLVVTVVRRNYDGITTSRQTETALDKWY